LRRKLLLVVVMLLPLGGGLLAAASSTTEAAQATVGEQNALVAVRRMSAEIVRLEETTWRWERLMGLPRTQTNGRVLAQMRVEDVREALTLWRRRAQAAARRAQTPPHLRSWLCIHRYEGNWTDAGAPFYGGLQMDISFQRRYGAQLLRTKGTADHWTPLEQIWVAERARRAGRGFYPWPNTARYCGLI
jgi:hypothetical protein